MTETAAQNRAWKEQYLCTPRAPERLDTGETIRVVERPSGEWEAIVNIYDIPGPADRHAIANTASEAVDRLRLYVGDLREAARVTGPDQPDTAVSKSPYAIGIDAGVAFCESAANGLMGVNPFPIDTDGAEEWDDGFAYGIETWENHNV